MGRWRRYGAGARRAGGIGRLCLAMLCVCVCVCVCVSLSLRTRPSEPINKSDTTSGRKFEHKDNADAKRILLLFTSSSAFYLRLLRRRRNIGYRGLTQGSPHPNCFRLYFRRWLRRALLFLTDHSRSFLF